MYLLILQIHEYDGLRLNYFKSLFFAVSKFYRIIFSIKIIFFLFTVLCGDYYNANLKNQPISILNKKIIFNSQVREGFEFFGVSLSKIVAFEWLRLSKLDGSTFCYRTVDCYVRIASQEVFLKKFKSSFPWRDLFLL